MLPDYYLNALGYDPLDIFRHELAHCNCWPANHPDTDVSAVHRKARRTISVQAQLEMKTV